ncbi:MAG: SurA N-terminal domain-containing protein, partial [Coriobacteriia bacterium]|nr:SurA N-terminal domain-containing protein [Coriobacteriia bacterium]
MKAFRVVVSLALVAGLFLGITGCSDKDVAARVNGEVIKKSELDAQVDKLKEQYPQMFEGADGEGRLIDFQQRLLDNMINNVLIRQAAKDAGVKVTDADVKKKIE